MMTVVARTLAVIALVSMTNISPAFASVISLLHMDGPNGSTTFTDEVGGVWSASSSAQISDTQSKFGGASVKFNGGIDDYIEHPDTSALELGATTPFTIDFWVRLNTQTSNVYLVGKCNADGGRGYDIRADNTRIAAYGFTGWTPGILSGNDVLQTDTWHHIAMTGTESTIYMFADGVLLTSANRNINTLLAGDRGFRIGDQTNYQSAPLNGYIDEFRFVSGEAVWTSSFTPPTTPHVVPEPATLVLLLICALAIGIWRLRKGGWRIVS